jgi:exonuclease III
MKNLNMKTIKTNKLIIAHLNINSIKNISKQLELNNVLLKNSFDILSLNETNLKSNNYLEMKQNNTIRQDNQNRKKGGIALVIIKELK